MFYSIIIPVYKVELYLEKCIDSILAQTFKNYEMILVDDGSPDSCGVICEDYAKKNENIKVIHQKNQGLSAARNTGLKEAKGDYIIFIDSDDYWLDNSFLEKVNSQLEQDNMDVLLYNFCKVFDNKLDKPYYPQSLKGTDGVDNNYIFENNLWISSSWNKVVKNEIIRANNLKFVVGVTSEDIEWSGKILKYANSFGYLNIVALGYVQRSGSITSSTSSKKVNDLINNIQNVIDLSLDMVGVKKQLMNRYIGYQVATIIFNLLHLDDVTAYEKFSITVKKMILYLKYSDSKKPKLLFYGFNILGFKNCMKLMKLMRI